MTTEIAVPGSCPVCGQAPKSTDPRGECSTMVGYFSPPGHRHDDNCLSRQTKCGNGHTYSTYLHRACPNPDCSWKGKETCFCHPGKKIDAWPKEEHGA